MTPDERRARGFLAKTLLNDAVIKQAWDELEADLRKEWEASWFPRKRDRIWSQLNHLKALRQKLASYAGHARD